MNAKELKVKFKSKEVDRITFTDYDHIACYILIKIPLQRAINLWVMLMVDGPHITAYVGAKRL